MYQPNYIIVHHSVTPRDLGVDQTENSIQNNHKSRGFPKSSLGSNIGYHYIIYGDGTVKQYRLDNEIGAHTKEQGMNLKSLGVCLIGDFDKELPSESQINSLKTLLSKKCELFKIIKENIHPHRKYAGYKSCYGANLSDDWASKLLTSNNDMLMSFKKAGDNTIYLLLGSNTLNAIS